MEIKNRIAGEWKFFNEEMPKEEYGSYILVYDDSEDGKSIYPCSFIYDGNNGMWYLTGSTCTYMNSEELKTQYSHYQIIRGPWEAK